jgi:Cu2+-exporting ATPase
MDHSPHADHGRASDPHASHKTSDLHEAHDRHAGHSVAMFRDKFWLSLALTIPVVFWSADVQHWLGYTAPSFPGSSFIPSVLEHSSSLMAASSSSGAQWANLRIAPPG